MDLHIPISTMGLYNLKMSFVGNGAVKDVAPLAKLIRNTT